MPSARDLDLNAPVPSCTIGSGRWKLLAVLTLLCGLLATLFAVFGVMQIDNAANTAHFSTGQDVVGVAATLIGIAGFAATAMYTLEFWRRPAITVDETGVTVDNLRPVTISWVMIAGTALVRRRGIPHRYVPALRLVGDVVVPLRFARRVYRRRGRASFTTSSALELVHVAVPTVLESRGTRLRDRRRRRARELPGTEARTLPVPSYPGRLTALLFVPALYTAGQLVIIQGTSGHAFNFAQFGLAVGAAELAMLLLSAYLWSSLTRRLAIGPEWLASKTRLARRWHILEYHDVVSTRVVVATRTKAKKLQRIMLQRADGTGVGIRAAELESGAAAPLLRALHDRPALTGDARRLLERLAGEPISPLLPRP